MSRWQKCTTQSDAAQSDAAQSDAVQSDAASQTPGWTRPLALQFANANTSFAVLIAESNSNTAPNSPESIPFIIFTEPRNWNDHLTEVATDLYEPQKMRTSTSVGVALRREFALSGPSSKDGGRLVAAKPILPRMSAYLRSLNQPKAEFLHECILSNRQGGQFQQVGDLRIRKHCCAEHVLQEFHYVT